MKVTLRGVCIGGAACVVLALAYLCLSPVRGSRPSPTADEKEVRPKQTKRIPVARTNSSVRVRKPRTAKSEKAVSGSQETVYEDWIMALAGREREIACRVSDALDNEDFEVIRGFAREVAASANEELRQQMVDALGWFGEKAVADLTMFLNDRSEDVAQSAFNHWDSAIDSVDNEAFKLAVATDAMKSLSSPDMLDNVATKLKGAEDEVAAVRSVQEILRSVKGDSAAAKAAKEAYEFITGEEYTTPGAALIWLNGKTNSNNEE